MRWAGGDISVLNSRTRWVGGGGRRLAWLRCGVMEIRGRC